MLEAGPCRRLTVALCAEAARHRDHHAIYSKLVDQNPELADRHARKLRHYAELVEGYLISGGTPRASATLAAQIALGCYQAAWRLAGHDAVTLALEVDAAFQALLDSANPSPER